MARFCSAAVLTVALSTLFACHDRPAQPTASLSIAEVLRGTDDTGYAKALEPRTFQFPQDHGPHSDFRTEWWYYTGNLETREGRKFGFQLTFFRSALAPEMPARTSSWATRQVYLSHFTVTDVAGKKFQSFERWGRGALGLAGAEGDPFHVWVGDWSAKSEKDAFPVHLHATQGDAELNLDLREGKPPVLQGDRGLSRKGAEPGNASYYYSLPRMPAAGTIRLGGESFAVTGDAWMDREWSTSSLGKDQIGWDWFALQLSGHREIMLYRLRKTDGSIDPASNGTVIGPAGEIRRLSRDDFSLTVLDRWRSPRSGAVYPSRWRLRIPSEGAEGLDLEIVPLLADQELDVSFRYWEGAVAVSGNAGGRGYVEMTGYTDPKGPPVSSRPPAR